MCLERCGTPVPPARLSGVTLLARRSRLPSCQWLLLNKFSSAFCEAQVRKPRHGLPSDVPRGARVFHDLSVAPGEGASYRNYGMPGALIGLALSALFFAAMLTGGIARLRASVQKQGTAEGK